MKFKGQSQKKVMSEYHFLISPEFQYRPGGGIGILSSENSAASSTPTTTTTQGGPPNRPLPPTPDDDAQGDRTLIMKRVSESCLLHSLLCHLILIFVECFVMRKKQKQRKQTKRFILVVK
jgi:hypothetical protein